VTWGPEETCPACHPDLYEPYGKPVVSDFSSGEPCTPDGKWIPHIIHCNGQWLRKKALMDPIKQLISPVAEVRKHVEQWVDEYGDTWAIVDGIETKVAYTNPVALLKRQDGVRVEIRAALDETGIRDKSKFDEELGYEVLPPGACDVFQIDLTRQHVPSARDGDIIEPVAFVPPPKLTRWQRIKRAAKRLLRRKKGRTR